jgi:hypothetical protein
MASITLDNVRHSYVDNPATEEDWALKRLTLELEDGGAYALLGPSGCGKTTMLNLISGLLRPTEGTILFDGLDVTDATPEARNIAQVFQFPVIYDTMTVYDNLAFPLSNRGVTEADVDRRVPRSPACSNSTACSEARLRPHRRRQAEDLARPRTGALRRQRHHVRRAAHRHRPAPQMGAALEAEGAAPPHPPHDDLRHPRPDRGADLRRPGRGDEGRRDRPDRHAGRPVRAPAAHLRRPFHRLAGHERHAVLRGRERRGDRCRPAGRRHATPPPGRGTARRWNSASGRSSSLSPATASPSTWSRSPTPAATASSIRGTGDLIIKALVGEDAEVPAGGARLASIRRARRVYEDGWLVR